MNIIRSIWTSIRKFWKSPKKFIVTVLLGAVFIALFIYSAQLRSDGGVVEFKDILEEEALSVNGESRTFAEIAFYIAYEEGVVEEQARVYNPEKPLRYWNLHIDGVFVRTAARNAAMQMALHDELFYQLAMEEGLTLSDEELESLASYEEDFWSDLCDRGGDEMLGVDRETISATMERMAYAQKYQYIYALSNGMEPSDYDFSSEIYERFLEEYKYTLNEKLWRKLKFGGITLTH